MANDPLDQLTTRLNALKAHETASQKDRKDIGRSSLALRLSIELLAGVLVGGVIGRALDVWLATTPWLLVLGIMLGFAGGVMNMKRLADSDEE